MPSGLPSRPFAERASTTTASLLESWLSGFMKSKPDRVLTLCLCALTNVHTVTWRVCRVYVGTNRLQVIVLASRKGGAGKTTLSSHLAVEAERAGVGRVALADTDPQGGLAGWFNARQADTPVFIDLSKGLPSAIVTCRKGGIDLLIIDTPPSITDTISGVVAHADMVIIPVRPSPNDLRAIGGTVDIVRKAGKPMIFAINQATVRARITGEAAIALSQHGTVAPSMIASRVDFATSMTDGRTAGELDSSSRSAAEITALWAYVAARMGGS